MGKKKKSKGGSFLMQGSILAAAGIITKIIGAVYRIPMLNIMGLKGQGYYDMAFQVYSIALIISSYSLPVAVSKLVSLKMAAGERKNAFRVLKASLIIATLSGVTIMVIVFFGAEAIAEYLMLFFEGACSRAPDLCDYGSFSWLFSGAGNDDPDCNFADH